MIKRKSYKKKKSVDVSFIFKLLLFFILAILVAKISISLIKIIINLFYKIEEVKTIKEIEGNVKEVLTKEPGTTIVNKLQTSKDIVLTCFTRPKEFSERLNGSWTYEDIKETLPSFIFDNEIKELSKNNEKNVFFIYKDGSYKAFLIKGLFASPFNKNPLCFKGGEKYYLINYKNIVIIDKKLVKS